MTEQEELQYLTKEILEQGYLLSLGVCDDDGVWVADVIYVFDDELNLYWMSKPWRRHSEAIAKRSQVAGTVTVTRGPKDPDLGLQLSGRAMEVADIPFELVKAYFKKREKPEPAPEDDVLGEHVWYKLVPDHVELIHEPVFGRERKTIC